MAGITDRRNKFFLLDKELCYALYLRLGSYDKVGARLETEGIYNPGSGRAFSRAGIRSCVLKSHGYRDYFASREKDPSLPPEPTLEEFEEAEKIIEKMIPIQLEQIQESLEKKSFQNDLNEDLFTSYETTPQS